MKSQIEKLRNSLEQEHNESSSKVEELQKLVKRQYEDQNLVVTCRKRKSRGPTTDDNKKENVDINSPIVVKKRSRIENF